MRGNDAAAIPCVIQVPNPQPLVPSSVHGACPTTDPAFQPRDITTNSTVEDILALTEDQFRVAFKGSPVKRAKCAGLRRNALAALAATSSLTNSK